jgi:hypothetical protein
MMGCKYGESEGWEVVNEKEKTRRKRREHESQEEQTAA